MSDRCIHDFKGFCPLCQEKKPGEEAMNKFNAAAVLDAMVADPSRSFSLSMTERAAVVAEKARRAGAQPTSQNEQSVKGSLGRALEKLCKPLPPNGEIVTYALKLYEDERAALLAEREELLAEIRASHEMLRDKTEEGAGEPPRLLCKCRFCLVGDST